MLAALCCVVLSFVGCVDDQNRQNGKNGAGKEDVFSYEIVVRVGGREFSALLEDSAAARGLLSLLPLTAEMNDMPAKSIYLPRSLPENAFKPDEIKAGDLMLWGSGCLVLFYEDFSASYSYTRLGRLVETAGLAEALGKDGVRVVFDLKA